MRPQTRPVDPARLPELARATMQRAKFPMLGSVEGSRPRLRPVSPVYTQGFTVFVASLRSSGKTAELQRNPAVELCYLDDRHDQVRIDGRAEVVTDARVRAGIWEANPLLRSFLGSIDNPEFMLYRIDPSRVRFMREWALEYFEVPMG